MKLCYKAIISTRILLVIVSTLILKANKSKNHSNGKKEKFAGFGDSICESVGKVDNATGMATVLSPVRSCMVVYMFQSLYVCLLITS